MSEIPHNNFPDEYAFDPTLDLFDFEEAEELPFIDVPPDVPKTPRQASDQSGEFVKRLREEENGYHGYKDKIKTLTANRSYAQRYLLESEESGLFARNMEHAFREIQHETDPKILATLWEDVLAFSTKHTLPGRLEEISEEVYSAERMINHIVYTDYIPSVSEDITAAVNHAYEDSDISWSSWTLGDAISETIRRGASGSSDEVDIRKLYDEVASLERYSMRYDKVPKYRKFPDEAKKKFAEIIKYSKEFSGRNSDDPVSPELAQWLTGFIDRFITKAESLGGSSSAKSDLSRDAAGVSDEEIASRARALVDEDQRPIIELARKHAENYNELLRQAAIAEAALDGVQINVDQNRE